MQTVQAYSSTHLQFQSENCKEQKFNYRYTLLYIESQKYVYINKLWI